MDSYERTRTRNIILSNPDGKYYLVINDVDPTEELTLEDGGRLALEEQQK